MMHLSQTEENYLKSLFHLTKENEDRAEVAMSELANDLQIKPASANMMLKKLKEKELVDYQRYGKISLTDLGEKKALDIIRKHRLWETFLYEKLDFGWEQVHEVAEQLEHIQSEKLIDKLEQFLQYPTNDPHGEQIPRKNEEFRLEKRKSLADAQVGKVYRVIGVKDEGVEFLSYVSDIGIRIKKEIIVEKKIAFDDSFFLDLKGSKVQISHKIAQNIFIM